MMGKIIQITTGESLYALTDDGKVYYYDVETTRTYEGTCKIRNWIELTSIQTQVRGVEPVDNSIDKTPLKE